MERIGLFGGTFNPPTVSHQTVGVRAVSDLKLDRLLLMPNKEPVHKPVADGPGAWNRLRMCQEMCSLYENWAAVDWELVRETDSYTIDSLIEFAERYPHAERWFVLGADSAVTLHTWEGSEQFAKLASFAVMPRDGGPTPHPEELRAHMPGINVQVLTAEAPGLSSTAVRARLHGGEDPAGMVCAPVADLITSHGWYLDRKIAALAHKARIESAFGRHSLTSCPPGTRAMCSYGPELAEAVAHEL